ncbi:Gfo/Idh/MocA family oxidoreductase [Solihabitans fulvus]|uniref:Gfo/Idh/MocA family oxidoreductase n=1 Tax=Solihabitans fulvus TaxID=1892852 RepID=A0A5B2XGL2_9PSEU|nr:Gfo/Idh/MocA family oxidoreductase [Solihabitans fulvus]KAA2262249.1 Gfo/Idh/MocA family oxidoreductase [Solihabitans fulvus]
MNEQLRVGLVGAGPWAQQVHAPGIADHPGTRLVSVWARRRDAAAEITDRFGGDIVADPDELLSTVDAVAFAVPPAVQAELATKAAKAGKHLILEKPIASTVDDAERLVDAVTEAKVASLVMLTRRFAPETRELLAEVDRLGGWAGGNATWLTGALLGGQYAGSQWRHDQGALDDIGPHAFDLLDAALGEITEVLAAHRSEPDLWHLMLAHRGGATSTATLTLRLPIRPTVTEYSLYGEHGRRTLAGWASTTQDCYTTLLDEFVALVQSGTTEHPCDVRRGLHLQRILAAARAKAEGVA